MTRFLRAWLETMSNTEPINNGFSELPALVRATAAASRRKSKDVSFSHHFLRDKQSGFWSEHDQKIWAKHYTM